MKIYKTLSLFLLFTGSFSLKSQDAFAQVVPPDFILMNININLDNDAIGFALLLDERILGVNQFSSTVDLIVNGNLKSSPLLTVPNLEAVKEKGLLEIAVDSNFPNTPHIYLFHSYAGTTNRVSRFIVEGDLADPNSENLSIPLTRN